MKKLSVILLVLVFAAPAMAADWNFYGSARVGFWYVDVDEDASGVTDDGLPTGEPESDTDLDMFLHSNSRIGAKVKTSDMVSGRFEYGTGVNLRQLFGTVKLGAASLLVGQTYTPIYSGYSGQVARTDAGLLKEGCVYEGRIPMLRLKIGGFQAAFVEPEVSGVQDNLDILLPKIELAYDMKMSAFSIGGFLGFQTYEFGPSNDSDTNTSYIIGVRSKIKAGPAYVNIVLSYAQNADDFGIGLRNDFAGGQSVDATGVNDPEDSSTIAAALVIGSKLGDSLKIEAGVGYLMNSVTDAETEVDLEGNAMTYYVQLPITLAKGVYIVPEISIFDLGENETDGNAVENGQRIDVGAKFQINF